MRTGGLATVRKFMPPEMVVNAPINQVVDGRNVLDRLARVVVTASTQTVAQTKPTPRIVVDGAVVEEMRGPGCGTTKFLVNGARSAGAFALLNSRECQHVTGLVATIAPTRRST